MSIDSTDTIKSELRKNIVHIHSFEQVDILLSDISDERPHRKYIIFDKPALKNYFLSNSPVVIINCNSSYERFCEDMVGYDRWTIFNNLKYCSDFDILNILKNTNNILIQ